MEILYWITVLGNLCALSGQTLGILIVAILLLGTYTIATATSDYVDEDDKAEARKYCNNIEIIWYKQKKKDQLNFLEMSGN